MATLTHQLLNSILTKKEFQIATEHSSIILIDDRIAEIDEALKNIDFSKAEFIVFFVALLLEKEFLKHSPTNLPDKIDLIREVIVNHCLVKQKLAPLSRVQKRTVYVLVETHIVQWIQATISPTHTEITKMVNGIVAT